MLQSGTLLIAVADGVSSAPHGGLGAHLAVQAALECAAYEAAPDSTHLKQRLLNVRGELAAHAIREGAPIDHFATTLMLVSISPSGVLHAAQVGDGAIVCLDGNGNLHRVIDADSAVPYANTVIPLTAPDAVGAVRTGTASAIAAAGVITDGLEPLALDRNQPFGAFWLPLLRFASHHGPSDNAKQMLCSWLRSRDVQRVTDDDCTLVLAWSPEQAPFILGGGTA